MKRIELSRVFFAAALTMFGTQIAKAVEASEFRNYQLTQGTVRMVQVKSTQLILSENCLTGDIPRTDCKAFSATRREKIEDLKFKGGENPGALICHQLDGQVVWATDLYRNQITLCRFSDETYISNGSLTRALYLKRFFKGK